MNIDQYLSRRKRIIERSLLSYLPKSGTYTKTLYDAVKYSLTTGGKRIRPIMTLAACEAVSGSYTKAMPLAVAIEMIHTYTLIHDDLPAMDDDDLRRGKPTTHKKFGEDIAILAGDMLNTLAFEIIASEYGSSASKIILELAGDLGLNGVVGGQAADLRAKGRKVDIRELAFINSRKTAYLFMASVACGAMAGGASRAVISRLKGFAMHLGLAFQITDDIFDRGRKGETGYPALVGLERSKIEAEKHVRAAIAALPSREDFRVLKEIGQYLADRKE